MEHVRWLAEPPLHSPTLVAAFTGWNDAGDAASRAVSTLVQQWGATAIAELDPEPFTDFATIRPHVRLDGGRRSIVWPTVGLWWAATPGGDVVLALGPEPALRWKLFSRQFVDIADRFGVKLVISLGALLADVAHSRPVHVIGTASDAEVIDRFDLQRSRYEGPTGIVGVLADALGQAGRPTASLWAAVPGYAQQIPSPKAALALVERACDLLGTAAPTSALVEEVHDYEHRLASMVAGDEDLEAYIARLESMADDEDDDGDDGDDGESMLDRADAGDELVAEVERFLRDQDQS